VPPLWSSSEARKVLLRCIDVLLLSAEAILCSVVEFIAQDDIGPGEDKASCVAFSACLFFPPCLGRAFVPVMQSRLKDTSILSGVL
jgi:hypothetical protein